MNRPAEGDANRKRYKSKRELVAFPDCWFECQCDGPECQMNGQRNKCNCSKKYVCRCRSRNTTWICDRKPARVDVCVGYAKSKEENSSSKPGLSRPVPGMLRSELGPTCLKPKLPNPELRPSTIPRSDAHQEDVKRKDAYNIARHVCKVINYQVSAQERNYLRAYRGCTF